MNKKQLIEYLKDSEISLHPKDCIKVVPFQHGTRVLFYHKGEKKPYKTRVYLPKIDDADLL
ncbi:MAG: hypothetical protein E6L03_09545 [Thaumarchaeota archaeon]|nr:MAG: hypothetical protein E6L03_09545 [Nitrososphaerota archaeon]